MNNPIYPLGYKVTHYRQARRLSLASAQAAGPLWEFQWGTTAGHICFVNRVTLKVVQSANATAEELRFNLTIARAFSAPDTTNTVSILRTGDMQQLETPYAASVLSAFRESNSATAPAGGTMTQDTDPIAAGSYVTLGTISTTFDGGSDVIFDFCPLQEGYQMLGLRKNEGWVINLEAQKGATTGVSVHMETAWTECFKPTTTVGGL